MGQQAIFSYLYSYDLIRFLHQQFCKISEHFHIQLNAKEITNQINLNSFGNCSPPHLSPHKRKVAFNYHPVQPTKPLERSCDIQSSTMAIRSSTIFTVLSVFTIVYLLFSTIVPNEATKTEKRKGRFVKREIELSEDPNSFFKLHAEFKETFQPQLQLLLPNIPTEVMKGADSFQILNYMRMKNEGTKLQREIDSGVLADEKNSMLIDKPINIPNFMTEEQLKKLKTHERALINMLVNTRNEFMKHPDYNQQSVDTITDMLHKYVPIKDQFGRSMRLTEILNIVKHGAKRTLPN